MSVAGLIAINSKPIAQRSDRATYPSAGRASGVPHDFAPDTLFNQWRSPEMADFLHELVSVTAMADLHRLYTLSGEPIMVVGEAPVNWQPAKGTEQD